MSDELNMQDLIQRYLHRQKELFGDSIYRKLTDRNNNEETVSKDHVDDVASLLQQSSQPGKKEAWKGDTWQNIEDLAAFKTAVQGCKKCSLGETRKNFVFGAGSENAGLMFIGEAPGAEEDQQGIPFVGRSGQLLDKILNAVELDRSNVYIANILKCRPPKNRDPQTSEIACCEPYLLHQIKIIRPVLIVALGRVAGQTLLRTTDPLGALRGKVHDYHGTDLMVTYHPAALLRNAGFKRPTWEDMQEIKRLYLEKMAKRV